MKTTRLSYEQLINLGNYENEKIGVEVEIGEREDAVIALEEMRRFVEVNSLKSAEIVPLNVDKVKFEIGDQVRVPSDLMVRPGFNPRLEPDFIANMKQTLGREGTIISFNQEGRFPCVQIDDGGSYYYRPDWLEKI